MRAFKSISAHRVNELCGRTGSLWQRNYYERVLRQGELEKARQYVDTNPLRWGSDVENPDCEGPGFEPL
jgi:putative transposase